MTEFGKSPLLSLKELEELGYRMVIFPMSAFRVAMKATDEFFRALKEQGTQAAWLDKMQTRKELYELLEYDPAAESWPGYDEQASERSSARIAGCNERGLTVSDEFDFERSAFNVRPINFRDRNL